MPRETWRYGPCRGLVQFGVLEVLVEVDLGEDPVAREHALGLLDAVEIGVVIDAGLGLDRAVDRSEADVVEAVVGEEGGVRVVEADGAGVVRRVLVDHVHAVQDDDAPARVDDPAAVVGERCGRGRALRLVAVALRVRERREHEREREDRGERDGDEARSPASILPADHAGQASAIDAIPCRPCAARFPPPEGVAAAHRRPRAAPRWRPRRPRAGRWAAAAPRCRRPHASPGAASA